MTEHSAKQKYARETGTQVEHWVAERLQQQGLVLLQHSFHCPVGEIDLIMQEKKEIAFIEIKYRSKIQYGTGAEAITATKKRRIIKSAQWYLQKNPRLAKMACRFDVIAIHHPEKEWNWIKYAFDAF